MRAGEFESLVKNFDKGFAGELGKNIKKKDKTLFPKGVTLNTYQNGLNYLVSTIRPIKGFEHISESLENIPLAAHGKLSENKMKEWGHLNVKIFKDLKSKYNIDFVDEFKGMYGAIDGKIDASVLTQVKTTLGRITNDLEKTVKQKGNKNQKVVVPLYLKTLKTEIGKFMDGLIKLEKGMSRSGFSKYATLFIPIAVGAATFKFLGAPVPFFYGMAEDIMGDVKDILGQFGITPKGIGKALRKGIKLAVSYTISAFAGVGAFLYGVFSKRLAVGGAAWEEMGFLERIESGMMIAPIVMIITFIACYVISFRTLGYKTIRKGNYCPECSEPLRVGWQNSWNQWVLYCPNWDCRIHTHQIPLGSTRPSWR